jgi:asparagine synthase (glutamine-hydrolysing)
MCGIAGVFNLNGSPVSQELLQNITRALAHRGPDGEGYFLHEDIGMGHQRLAILDTSDAGAQPMASENGDWWIVFNGCIYNYPELKKELKSKGHTFKSQCDTEVITEGLAAYGPAFFSRLNGMFAIAAWNKITKELFLTRDRFGVKPLYYWMTGKTVVFASEIKAILKHPSYSISVNPDALNEYFTFQNLFAEETLFNGIHLLSSGTTLKISSAGASTSQWWDYNFSAPEENMSLEEATSETLRLLKQAVERQLISDVPVGSYLSGGMDSGAITSIASGHIKRLATFTCGFDMSEVTGVEANYDERRDAELMANSFKTEHFEQVINAGDLSWSLPRVVWHLEDLKVGMSYPNYYISRLASKFVKVALQGTGGDELFGGYPWRYYRVFKSLHKEEYLSQYYEFWQRLVPDQDKKGLFQPHIFKPDFLEKPRQAFETVFNKNGNLKYDTPENHIQNSLYFEIKTFLPGLLLVGDKLSMAHGLEERFPFLDNDLVDFAQKIPVKHKLGNLEMMKKLDENVFGHKRKIYKEFDDGKNVLRRAMEDLIPEKIINRKKQGFSAPDESWYRGENASYVKELLMNPKARLREFISPVYIEKIVHEHMNLKINHRLLIWSFMNFEWWCRLFLEGEKFE